MYVKVEINDEICFVTQNIELMHPVFPRMDENNNDFRFHFL